MMGNDNNQDSKNGLISILLLIMMVTGTAINNPLISSRPYESQNSKLISPEAHKVDARLWQDPIASIGKHVLQMKEPDTDQLKKTNSFDNFIKEIPNRVNKSNDLRVIAISVFGSSYPELVEFRQRYRYAVVSALGSRGYFPQDNEHLGFFLFDKHLANNSEIYVPYEWFERDQESSSGDKERLLILWLNEEKIISNQYGNFVKNLFDQFSKVQSNKSSFTLIGPTNTSKLIELMKSTEIDGLSASFKIISSSATISDNDLFNAYKKKNQCDQGTDDEKRKCKMDEIVSKLAAKSISDNDLFNAYKTKCNQGTDDERRKCITDELAEKSISDNDLLNAYEKANQCNLSTDDKKRKCIRDEIASKLAEKSIIRTIGQDENLAKALVWELEQRGVNREIPIIGDKCKDRLIVISEQDSFYARALTKHFIDSVDAYCKPEKSLVTKFTYLRGLDGKLPDLDESNKKSQDTQDKKEKKNLIAQLDDASPEHAEGRNQFDYLRRLIDRIEELDRGDGLGANRIKAIGIFGNDVYDKLLILQALRDRFKHKIFFTTELDARYLHADQTKWARNLVVASNFDLTLRPELQGSIMPFRDSYQTSMYLATLLALDSKIQPKQEKLNKLFIPQIFEVGRSQAVHLATLDLQDTSNEPDICSVEEILPCSSLELNRKKEVDAKTVSQLLLLILLIFTLSYFVFKSYLERLIPLEKSIIYIVIISGPILFFCYWDNFPYHENGEPFLWFEGVSVWPNLVIRYLGIIFILVIFSIYYNKLREVKEFSSDLKLPEPKKSEEICYHWEGLWQGPFSGFKSPNKETKALWFEYLQITDYRKSNGWLWILCATTISLGLTYFGLFSLGYLNFPSRGLITQYGHYLLALIQFFILWGLVYWVGYEATACRRFIDQLKPNESFPDQLNWPLALMEKHEKRTGISRDKLKPYFRFLLITRLIKRINSIIYIPFILMLLIAIGRSNVFDNLGFSPALVIVFIGASTYLIATLILLRKSAEKQCDDILQYYEEDRPGKISLASGSANIIDPVVTEIRNKKQQTFARFLQRPSLLALLLPGGGIGLTSIIEYLYN